MQLNNLSTEQIVVIIAIVIWDVTWKGFALWKAARSESKGWFIVLLLLNSIGLLPIIYLLLSNSAKSPKS